MVFKYAIHDGTNAALHSGPQGSKQPTAATIRRAEGRTTKRPWRDCAAQRDRL